MTAAAIKSISGSMLKNKTVQVVLAIIVLYIIYRIFIKKKSLVFATGIYSLPSDMVPDFTTSQKTRIKSLAKSIMEDWQYWGFHDKNLLESFINLSDAEFIAVINDYNALAKVEENKNFTEQFLSESFYGDDEDYAHAIRIRLKRLNIT